MYLKAAVLSLALLAAELVAGHGVIIKAVGDNGQGQSAGLGMDPNTPRDNTRRNSGQQDSTRFNGPTARTVGETLGGGPNDIESGTQAIMAMTGQPLAQVKAGGTLTMTVHQVNADGAGPYSCMINSDATAQSWQKVDVTTNLPGNRQGLNPPTNKQDQPLKVQIPAGQQCTGTAAGQQNVCMVRCQIPAQAGPFGGVVPVQMTAAAAAAPAAGVAGTAGTAAGAVAGTAGAGAVGSGNSGAGVAGAGTAGTAGASVGAAGTAGAAGASGAGTAGSGTAGVGTAGVGAAGVGAAGVGTAGVGAAGVGAAGVGAANSVGAGAGQNNKRAAFIKTRAVEFSA
ncbi:CAS1 protein [Hirsutella rhossiliensis]|uniref:CAS1 protein n=1 Tax=Hirsutella rhossiliensis TaxID=111463 RepID=A0A9P8MV48_9HYPO|nr:CAS1 protein [Hirsutella rhossiliensis]KAH0961825.1 CAS1 protein [Hirsutella rhossiliensis]